MKSPSYVLITAAHNEARFLPDTIASVQLHYGGRDADERIVLLGLGKVHLTPSGTAEPCPRPLF